MKFSFEKAKESAKKIVMGVGVISASYGNLDAKVSKTNIENPKQTEVENSTEKPTNTTTKELREQRERNDQEKIDELEKELGIDDTDNNNPNAEESSRDKYLKYMENPSYKDRLAKEMFSDKILDEEMKESVNQEYKDRLDQVKNVDINIDNNLETSEFTPKNNEIHSSENVIFHELSHAAEGDRHNSRSFEQKVRGFKAEGRLMAEKKKLIEEKSRKLSEIMTPEAYEKNHEEFISLLKKHLVDIKNYTDFKTDKIESKINNDYDSKSFSVSNFLEDFNLKKSGPNFKMIVSKDKQSYTLEEELFSIKESIPKIQSDFINKNNELLKKLTSYESVQDSYDKKIGPLVKDLFYLKNGTEIRARLNYLRMKAIENYNFDQKNDFNINDYEKLKADPQYNDLKINLGFSDEQINELMKNTASLENTNDSNYHHVGWKYEDENNNQA